MALLDQKFKANKLRYTLQCLLATGAVVALLTILDVISNAAVIGALGSSAFIAFTIPHANVSKPRFLIGGYLRGVAAGTLCHWLSHLPAVSSLPIMIGSETVIVGALSVGLAMFLMVITNTEHPPAAGAALGLVATQWHWRTVVVILVGVVLLVLMGRLLRRYLMNLI